MSRRLLALALLAVLDLRAAGDEGQLVYRARMLVDGQEEVGTLRFRVRLQKAKVTRNRRQRARFGSWVLEPVGAEGQGAATLVLPRLERLLYLGGPAEGMAPTGSTVKVARKHLRGWRLRVPDPVRAVATLAEVRRGLLALASLRGTFPGQGIRDLELELEAAEVSGAAAPPEQGAALLSTLARAAKGEKACSQAPEVVQ